MYRSFGAPGASRGTDADVAEASEKCFKHIAPKLGVPLEDRFSGLNQANKFYEACYGSAGAKPFGPQPAGAATGLTTLDAPLAKTMPGADLSKGLPAVDLSKGLPGADIAGKLGGGLHGIFDMAGHMDPTMGIFKAVVEVLSQLFSTQGAADLVCGVLPPMELYNQTIEAAYESTKFLVAR
jgi:hypothetical protein